jgi:hypothetical protein
MSLLVISTIQEVKIVVCVPFELAFHFLTYLSIPDCRAYSCGSYLFGWTPFVSSVVSAGVLFVVKMEALPPLWRGSVVIGEAQCGIYCHIGHIPPI